MGISGCHLSRQLRGVASLAATAGSASWMGIRSTCRSGPRGSLARLMYAYKCLAAAAATFALLGWRRQLRPFASLAAAVGTFRVSAA